MEAHGGGRNTSGSDDMHSNGIRCSTPFSIATECQNGAHTLHTRCSVVERSYNGIECILSLSLWRRFHTRTNVFVEDVVRKFMHILCRVNCLYLLHRPHPPLNRVSAKFHPLFVLYLRQFFPTAGELTSFLCAASDIILN